MPGVPLSNLEAEWRVPVLQRAYGQLAGRLRLIQYDGRGTGRSQRDVTDVSLDADLRDLDAVLDAAGATDVVLLGFEGTEDVVRLLSSFTIDPTSAARPATPKPGRWADSSDVDAGLSPREREVLGLIAGGESNGQIAARLELSINTVERHVSNTYRKIDARGRADATAWAIRHGLA